MKSPLKKIGIILVIILLPALFYSVYVLSSLNKDEEAIASIYNRQLDAILYSVNRYSEDVISTWVNQLDEVLSHAPEEQKAGIDKFLSENPVDFLISGDKSFMLINSYFQGFEQPDDGNDKLTKIRLALRNKPDLIEKLIRYKQSGYGKIENVAIENSDSFVLLFISNTDPESKFYGIVIHPDVFIRKILANKLQEITQDQFIIAVYNSQGLIYSTEEADVSKLQQHKQLWFFSGINLGIMLKGPTIDNLIRERTNFNVLLLVIMNLILLAGIWFVFRNVKKEIELAQIKSDFVSNVSHELRTPLALINMFAETLEMGRVRTEEKKQEYYSIISHEASRLSSIVNKILSFSRMEAGKVKYNFTCLDLNNTLDKILTNYSFHLQNNGFNYSIKKEESLPCINADPEAVQEAVINLLDNAMKYSKDIKMLEIKTGVKDNFGFVEVTDHGLGISAADQKKIFEKFFRVSSGLIHNTKGTGLGLTLVKHIMDAHKGKIELSSEPGIGSSFRLLFNIYNAEKK